MLSSSLKLTDEELILLDGKCRPEIQKAVDAAKDRLSSCKKLPNLTSSEAGFVADVVRCAQLKGILSWQPIFLKECKVCGTSCEYRKYLRRGKWHNKGDPDYSHPIYLSGMELDKSRVFMQGYANLGACRKCMTKLIPSLTEALLDVHAELPSELSKGKSPTYKRWDNMQCTECNWTGHEGQMRRLRTMMGDGTYPGGCPNCKAENHLFGRTIVNSDGFTLVEE
jgi:hypothetical protein